MDHVRLVCACMTEFEKENKYIWSPKAYQRLQTYLHTDNFEYESNGGVRWKKPNGCTIVMIGVNDMVVQMIVYEACMNTIKHIYENVIKSDKLQNRVRKLHDILENIPEYTTLDKECMTMFLEFSLAKRKLTSDDYAKFQKSATDHLTTRKTNETIGGLAEMALCLCTIS